MIEIANQRFRNLQEQVAWLTLMINRATDIVKNIAGTAPDVASLAPASTYSNGTTFAIGAAAPYDYYVALNGNWVELGTMPLAGPAGTNGTNGYNVLLTSQATTSGTSFIYAASIYDPESRGWKAGDLIFSEQGDVFVVTAATAAGAAVVYRYNIMGPTGPQGEAGTGTYYSSASTTSSTTSIAISTVYNPGSQTIDAGDIIISSTGDMFTVTGTSGVFYNVTYRTSIVGPQGVTGAAGKGVYYSSDATTSSTTVITGTSIYNPDSRTIGAGDIILSSTGDIFTVTSTSGSVANVTYRENIVGAPGTNGTNGADGSMFYAGDVVYCSAPADPGDPQLYIIAEADLPSGIKDGDYYMVNSTYTSGGVSISNGDLLEVVSILSGIGGYLIKVGNIAGPQGPAGPGMPAVTVADAGKFAVVNSSGQWAAITMTEWSGGNY